MNSKQVALITGASTGFGRLFTETLARNGHTVFATMRDLGGSRALRTLVRIRLLRPSERGQCDLLFLEERPCFRRRQGFQFLRPPIAPMTVSRAGFLIPFAGMATQFI